MNKEICFKIDSVELFLEQVLVEYNQIPVYFICLDERQTYYIVLCVDIDEEKYIIVKSEIERLIKLLSGKITMRDIMLLEKKYWEIIAGEDVDNDNCMQIDMEKINKEDLPYENSYFKLSTKAHKKYFTKLENIVMEDYNRWQEIDTSKNLQVSELDVNSGYKKTITNEYTEIKNFKLDSSYSNKTKNINMIESGKFVDNSISVENVKELLYKSKSVLSYNNDELTA